MRMFAFPQSSVRADSAPQASRPLSALSVSFGLAFCVAAVGCSSEDGGGGSAGGSGGGRAAGGAGGVAGGSGDGGSGGMPDEPQGGMGGSDMTGGAGGAPMGGSGGTGGAGGSGGSGGSGGNGGTGGTGQPTAACEAPTCDNFESYAAGSKPGGQWHNFDESGGSLSVSDGKAFSGTKSMRFSTNPGGSPKARMEHKGNGMLPRDDIHMRAMFFVEDVIRGQEPFHWNYLQVRGDSGNMVTGGSLQGQVFHHGVMNGSDCSSRGRRFPVDEWYCLEFHVDGAKGNVQTYVNGRLDQVTEVKDDTPIPGAFVCLDNATKWSIPDIRTVFVGLTMTHRQSNNGVVWMDDFAISDERIGCPEMK